MFQLFNLKDQKRDYLSIFKPQIIGTKIETNVMFKLKMD
ncbi:hypothetical protein N481_02360 [Pseudoalteromonas luteoviolacea S4047-1]|uniref:Uncharacterized protein n=1 Tax=Pseudoalteromonas luteoviolacea S4054 TaxID=1129367 RepID=A0A0F6A8A3_9GAMM|nr:hypothetical protein N479_18410 [Pseudoalteromonas luteoviolacea S4054]KZN67411.1 hypothetical protein N481_02360 [Pseudoalteromonas luteoviolacea S4047-1]